MAVLKIKDAKTLNEKEMEEKLKELKLELIKRKTGRESKVKMKEIKKAIARLLTIANQKNNIRKTTK